VVTTQTLARIPIEKGASLYQRADNKVWWLDLAVDGDRIRKSLKTADRAKALLIARELVTAALAGRWNVRFASEVTLEKGLELFNEEYEKLHHSESTQTYTRLLFARFGDFMAERHPGKTIKLDAVRRDDIVAFQIARAATVTVRKTPISAATVNRDVRELQTIFNWACDKGIVRMNPCRGVKALKGIKRVKKPLTSEEIKKLVARLLDVLADLAKLILNTGLRLGEAVHLRGEDIDLATKLLLVRSRPEYPIKDREEREVPCSTPRNSYHLLS
jgi:integrase